MTGPAISTACPPALGRDWGPAPVDSPWKSLRAPRGRCNRSASSRRSGPNCYSPSQHSGPNTSHHRRPNTEFLTLPGKVATDDYMA